MLDNLSPHKDQAALALIEQAGAEVRFLPPYSPDFDPIEKCGARSRPCCAAPKPESTKR